MKKIVTTSLAILLVLGISSQTINTKDNKINFKIRNVGLFVKGSFELLNADIKIKDDDLLKSRFIFRLKSNSLNTKNQERDKEWMDTIYFFTNKFPEISFLSDTIREADGGYLISGKFRIKNRSMKIFIPVRVQKSKGKIIYKGEFVIDRRDFDIAPSNMTLGNKMTFTFEIFTE
ncbi:YceI family protein [Bacteroidota bacterium]